MRKILLAATAAVCAAGAFNSASAQTPIAVNSGVAGWNSAPGTPVPGPTPGPGSITVNLRGRLFAGVTLSSDSGDSTTTGKEQALGMFEYARLYPSFSGVAANGIKYGAFLEIRQNSGGVGPSSLTGSAAITSGNASGNTLIFRRETGYISSDNYGTVRFGQTDQAIGLMMTGTFENFDIGGSWNGDFPALINSATAVTWPFLENSGTYGYTSITYLSPQFSGFDFGLSYQPNSGTSAQPNCSFAQADSTSRDGCLRSTQAYGNGTTAWSANTFARPVNEFQAVGRYQGAFGPVGVAATVGYVGAGLVSNGGAFTGTQYGFQNPSAIDVGALVTYGGLAVGGHYYGGKVNPNGGNNAYPTPAGYGNASAFVVGSSYAMGQFIFGANFVHTNRAGNIPGTYTGAASGAGSVKYGTMAESGLDIGGTYAVAPGWAASLSYYYGIRHQTGANLLTSSAGLSSNNLHAQGVILENLFTW